MKDNIRCSKSANPYTGCCLRFDSEDDIVLHYMTSFVMDIKRVNKLPMTLSGEDARLLDKYCSEVSAYLNGRIIGAVKQLEAKVD